MSILPSFLEELSNVDIAESEESKVIEVPREYGIDFTTGQLTGKMVEGLEAIKVWVWLCMHTERFRHAIYSSDYGTSLEQYFGEVTDALLMNEYIESIEDFEVVRNFDTLNIKFRVVTKFGSLEVDESVRR